MMKISEMTYIEFMRSLCEYTYERWNNTICKECGGLGIVPVRCCNGESCGCQGEPVDFKLGCASCKRKAPTEVRAAGEDWQQPPHDGSKRNPITLQEAPIPI